MSGRKRRWREMDHNQNYQYDPSFRGRSYSSSHSDAPQACWPGFHASFPPEFQQAGPHLNNPAYPTSAPGQNYEQWTHQRNQHYPSNQKISGPTSAAVGQRTFANWDQHHLQDQQRQDLQYSSSFAPSPHLPHFSESRSGPFWPRCDPNISQQQFSPHGQHHTGFHAQFAMGQNSGPTSSQRLPVSSAGPPPRAPYCGSQHDQQHWQHSPRPDFEQHNQPYSQNYQRQSPPQQAPQHRQQSRETYPQSDVPSETIRLLYPHSGGYNTTFSPAPQESRYYTSETSHTQTNSSKQKQETGKDTEDLPDKQTGPKRRHRRKGGVPETVTAVEKKPQDEKEKLAKEMVQSVRSRFPNLHNQLHFVPPLRFFKTKYTRLERYSTTKYQVSKQSLTDPSAMIGDLTEEAVTKCVARMVEATNEPMFVLLNYQFDYYLFELGRKPVNKEKKKTRETGEPGMVPKTSGSEFAEDAKRVPDEGKIKGKRCSDESRDVAQTGVSESSVKRETCDDPSSFSPENHFPLPKDLGTNYKRGDFDILVIHPRLGFIVFEAKTMRGSMQKVDQEPVNESSHAGRSYTEDITTPGTTGDENFNTEGIHKTGTRADENPNTNPLNTETSDTEEGTMTVSEETEQAKGITDHDVVKTIEKGLKQLRKATEVLRHLVSDLREQPTVTTVLALPNIPRARLRKLADHPDVNAGFKKCFQTDNIEGALGHCLCAEEAAPFSDVQTSSDESEETIQDDSLLLLWWADLSQKIIARGGGDRPPDGKVLSREVYEQIIGRFCGRHSRLSGATTAECINLTGIHFGKSILREEQLNILDSDERFVFLLGPPGTGKTLVLGLKASDWALEGYHVVILCAEGVNWGTLVSWTLHERVKERVRSCGPRHATGKKRSSEDEDRGPEDDARIIAEGGQTRAERQGEDDKATRDGRTKDDKERRTQRKEMTGDGETQKTGQAMNPTTEKKTKTDGDDDVETRRNVLTAQDRTTPKGGNTQDGDTTDVDTSTEEKEHAVDDDKHPLAETGAEEDSAIPRAHCLSPSIVAHSAAIEGDKQCAPSPAESRSSCNLRRTSDNNPRVDYSEFVHCERIQTTAIADTFVKGLLAKHTGGKGVKFILDEFQRQSTIEEQEERLHLCHSKLQEIKSLYKVLVTASGRSQPDGGARVEDTLLPRSAVEKKEPWKESSECCSSKQPHSCLRSRQSEWKNLFSESQGRESSVNETQNQPILPNEKRAHSVNQSQSRKGPARQNEARSANQSPSQPFCHNNPKKVNRKGSHKKKTSSPSTDKAEVQTDSCHRLSSQDLFNSMDTRLGYMSKRLKALRASNGSRYFSSAELWEESLGRLEGLTNDVRICRTQAENVVNPGEQKGLDADFVAGILEGIDALMVAALGALFHAYNALTFFVENEILAQVRKTQEQDPSLDISLWSSCVCRHYSPEGYVVKKLHQILRCPPTVQEVMMLTDKDLVKPPGYKYITRGCDANPPLPCDGPEVKWIDHAPHMTSVKEVIDCQACAQVLADYLLVNLNVGHGHGRKQSSKDSLYLHDVLLSGSPIHKPDCVFVKELQNRKIPLVYESQDLRSPPPYPGNVCVIGGSIAQGLEAKILVYVPEIKRIFDEKGNSPNVSDSVFSTGKSERRRSDSIRRAELESRLDALGHWNRQYLHQIASRSLSHLIVFHV